MTDQRTNPPSPRRCRRCGQTDEQQIDRGLAGDQCPDGDPHDMPPEPATPSAKTERDELLLRSARTWWNNQDYRAAPETIVENLSVLLGLAYNEGVVAGQQMGQPSNVRDATLEEAAQLVERLASGYASDPHRVRCRHVARELRALRTEQEKPMKEPGAKRCHVKCNNVAGCLDEPELPPSDALLMVPTGWTLRRGATVIECDDCAFAMGIEHAETDDRPTTCPVCEEAKRIEGHRDPPTAKEKARETSGLAPFHETVEDALQAIETWDEDDGCPCCLTRGGHGHVWDDDLEKNVACPVEDLRRALERRMADGKTKP